jgi:hypothetical protein
MQNLLLAIHFEAEGDVERRLTETPQLSVLSKSSVEIVDMDSGEDVGGHDVCGFEESEAGRYE